MATNQSAPSATLSTYMKATRYARCSLARSFMPSNTAPPSPTTPVIRSPRNSPPPSASSVIRSSTCDSSPWLMIASTPRPVRHPAASLEPLALGGGHIIEIGCLLPLQRPQVEHDGPPIGRVDLTGIA